MSKTPKQMAREYAITRELFDPHRITFDSRLWLEQGFLAGYQAAKDETNLPTPAKWISVKDRLPEVGVYVLVTHRISEDYTRLKVMEGTRISDEQYEIWGDHAILADYVDYWMPLPEAPKGEG